MPLDKEEDWQPFYRGDFRGDFTRAQSGIYEGRIEPIATPPLFNKPIIRILAKSATAKPTWYLAGTLAQEIGLGMEFQNWKIPLNRSIIAKIELYGKYRLRFSAVPWLRNLRLEIDTYEGVIEQQQIEEQLDINTEQIDELTQEIQGLNNLINSLELPQ